MTYRANTLLMSSLNASCALRRRSIALTVALQAVPFLSACGDGSALDETASVSSAIFRGERTEVCDWPEVVSLGGCTGTLIHPRLMVYAAHCGVELTEAYVGLDMMRSERRLAIDFCEAYPDHKLGDGTDVAFCVLKEAVTDIVPARPLAGCEAERLISGVDVVAVGFGRTEPMSDFGVQHEGNVRIASVGDELIMEDGEVDTCVGDSGGPVFVDLPIENGKFERRLVGITSAGTERQCGEGIGHYVNLTRKLKWLEDASNIDVTPCFDHDGNWVPTQDCVSQNLMVPNDDGSSCLANGESTPLSTCGAPYENRVDRVAPSIRRQSPKASLVRRKLNADERYVDYEIRVSANDNESGVKAVEFTLRSDSGKLLHTQVDEVAPYGLPILRLPAGHYTFFSEAQDYAGNKNADEITFDIEGPETNASAGCTMAPLRHPTTSAGFWLLSAILLARSWHPRKRPETSQRLVSGKPGS